MYNVLINKAKEKGLFMTDIILPLDNNVLSRNCSSLDHDPHRLCELLERNIELLPMASSISTPLEILPGGIVYVCCFFLYCTLLCSKICYVR